jgi:hypothetical protein
MGIKFRCPNGHKLNVKSFLAGKRGVCPKCGTSMRIPLESTRGEESAADAGEGDDLLDEARFPAPGRAAALAPAATAADPKSSARAVTIAAPTAIPVAASEADPIAESPAAVWYVRPPGGDQYGPARGDIMRRWLAEGRVSTDSLVWREGWSDWLTASEVFPSLKPAAAQPPALPSAPSTAAASTRSEPPSEPPNGSTIPERSARLTNRYESRRKQGSGLGIAVIVILGLLCVVLAILLVYVFVFSGGSAPKAKSAAAAADASHVRVTSDCWSHPPGDRKCFHLTAC